LVFAGCELVDILLRPFAITACVPAAPHGAARFPRRLAHTRKYLPAAGIPSPLWHQFLSVAVTSVMCMSSEMRR
jgi:hypothetical protein